MTKKMKKFSMSEDVLAAVIGYIQNRPLKEVMQLMTILQSDIKFIGEEDVERPDEAVLEEKKEVKADTKKVEDKKPKPISRKKKK